MWNFSCFSETSRNPISAKKQKNANARVWRWRFGHLWSSINVFYFFRMLFRNYNILPMKKWENYKYFTHEKAATNMQTLHAFSFFSITWNHGGQTAALATPQVIIKGPFKYLNDQFFYPFIFLNLWNPYPFIYTPEAWEGYPFRAGASPSRPL